MKRKHYVRRRSYRLLAWSCATLIVLIALTTAGWYIQGGRVLTVQSGSMTPVFAVGDGVLTQPVAFKQLRPGDIIAYRSSANDTTVISHRILRVLPVRRQVITKGDALQTPDPAVSANRIVGRAWAVAPDFGRLAGFIRRPIGLALALYVPACVIIGTELYRFLYSRPGVYHFRQVI